MNRRIRTVLASFATIVVVVVSVVSVRGWSAGRGQAPELRYHAVPVDTASVVERLAVGLRIRTVSSATNPDTSSFKRLASFLESSFPSVHAATTRETVADLSLLYTWPGTDRSLDPVLFAAHLDVVPADDRALWTHPPFSGTVADGFIWGRGALDDRNGVFGLLEAAERLLSVGYRPERTVLFAFGHDEELGGDHGAARIAALLRERGVEPVVAVDEGGLVSHGMIPGVTRPVAVVGTSEKGSATLRLTARAAGGHSSIPSYPTAIGRLSSAIVALESHPMPTRFTAPTWGLFAAVMPYMPLGHRLAFANRWLTERLLLSILASGPTTNAAVRTTTAATVIRSGYKANVLPAEAEALVNFRLLPGDTPEDVLAHATRVIDDPEVGMVIEPGAQPASTISDPNAPAFRWLSEAIRSRFERSVVAPFLFVGGTDGKHYAGVAQNVYRFLPIEISPDEPLLFHAVDERISIEAYAALIGFYVRLLGSVAYASDSSSPNLEPEGGR